MAGIHRLRRQLGALRARRRAGDRGAVAVEAALITPLLILLLFGIIEFGFVFKNYLAVSSSARSGVRIASAMPRTDGFAQAAAEAVLREGQALDRPNIQKIWVYDADGKTGLPSTGNFDSCSQCVTYTVTSSGNLSGPSGSWPYDQQNACLSDPDHTYIGVYVEYANPGVTGLVFENLTLTDRSVMSLEPMSNTAVCRGPVVATGDGDDD